MNTVPRLHTHTHTVHIHNYLKPIEILSIHSQPSVNRIEAYTNPQAMLAGILITHTETNPNLWAITRPKPSPSQKFYLYLVGEHYSWRLNQSIRMIRKQASRSQHHSRKHGYEEQYSLIKTTTKPLFPAKIAQYCDTETSRIKI